MPDLIHPKEHPQDILKLCLERYYADPSLALWRACEYRILQSVGMEEPILDLGCGDGWFAHNLIPTIYVGLDMMHSEILKASRLPQYKFVVVADAGALPFRPHTFKTIFSNCAMEHFKNVGTTVAEMARILAPGGHLITTVMNDQFKDYLFFPRILRRLRLQKTSEQYLRYRYRSITLLNDYGIDMWNNILKNNGLIIDSFQYYAPPATVKIWDFLCEAVRIHVGRFSINYFLIRMTWLRSFVVFLFSKLLHKYYMMEDKMRGGGILIVGLKNKS